MQPLAIIVMSMLMSITYGIAHDQITARLCLEYFTVFHPQVFPGPVEDPTVIALVWGVLATWWVGLILGAGLAIAARAGSKPKRTVGELAKPVATLMLAAAAAAVAAGMVGHFAARLGWVYVAGIWAERIPAEQHIWFLTDLWAHNASYAVGFLGGLLLMRRVWRSRDPHSQSGNTAHNEL
ncbi:MAG: hypothetical protein KC910_23320 [Candidatus Eremiobacteraeota bacterium]|nr:hypothetical protein [Planctomycetales bacterium]MCA9794766.1 hypothetical protein [Candidatus Eremiobacteraeota bacterium]